jgi:hypothetical protein
VGGAKLGPVGAIAGVLLAPLLLTGCAPEDEAPEELLEKEEPEEELQQEDGKDFDEGDSDENSSTDNELGYEDFLDKIAMKESSNNYQAVSGSGTFLGRYQMGPGALIDAKFKKLKTGEWDEKTGVDSDESFLENPIKQEEAIRSYHRVVWGYVINSKENEGVPDLRDYLGTSMNDVEITESGLLAAAHLVGHRALRRAILAGDLNSEADGNGTTAREYMENYGGFNIDEITNPPKKSDDEEN